MSSDEEMTEEEQFVEMASKNAGMVMTAALLAAGIDTMDKLLAQHGMAESPPSDPAITGVLRKLQSYDNSINMDIRGLAADGIRLLQRKSSTHSTPPSKKAKISTLQGSAEENAADTKVAKKAFDRLATWQNVKVAGAPGSDRKPPSASAGRSAMAGVSATKELGCDSTGSPAGEET